MKPLVVLALAVALAAVATAQDPSPPQQPNIVVFLVDDMGWQDTSVPFWTEPTPFNAHFRTPAMGRLAAQGMRFSNAYSCAVCSPSRTSLMTGQNAARHHVTQWTLTAGKDQSGKRGRVESPPAWRTEGLQPDAVTLPRLLHDAGYHTIHAGKAHWGAEGTPGEDPRALGFDVNIAGHCAGAPGSYQGIDDYGKAQGVWGVPGLDQYHGLPVHLTDALTAEALAALREPVARGQPFYLYLAHYAVHAPIQRHAPYDAAYRDAGCDEPEACYASMVEGMDRSLAAVLRWLDEHGVAENTLVLFGSDNGGLSVHARGKTPRGTGANTHNWPLRAGKGSAYEGGTRVPEIVAWAKPAERSAQQARIPVAHGAVCDVPTLIEDWFPTILRWAGVAVPDGLAVDGHDFTALLDGAQDGEWDPDRAYVFHYPHVWGPVGPGYEPHSSIRVGAWKAIWFYDPQRWELYHLANDLGEEHDLAASEPARLRALAARLVRELDARGAQYPIERNRGTVERPAVPGD